MVKGGREGGREGEGRQDARSARTLERPWFAKSVKTLLMPSVPLPLSVLIESRIEMGGRSTYQSSRGSARPSNLCKAEHGRAKLSARAGVEALGSHWVRPNTDGWEVDETSASSQPEPSTATPNLPAVPSPNPPHRPPSHETVRTQAPPRCFVSMPRRAQPR